MLRGGTAIAKFIAVVALVVGAGAALLVSGVVPVGAQMPVVVDYDVDDNGLIEVGNLDQLNAMRWDLDGDGDPAAANTSSYLAAFPGRDVATSTRMGCPMGNCMGYELMADLVFPAATGTYNPWAPVGPFDATFAGNGRTLTGMRVNVSAGHAGLFGRLGGSSTVREVGIIDAHVTTTAVSSGAGPLVGRIESGGQVYASYAQGGSITLAALQSSGGGLAGENAGDIRASYATAAVGTDGPRTGAAAGGLVGWLNAGAITASYAAGSATGTGPSTTAGGLVGFSSSGSVTASYCDVETSMRPCIGGQVGSVVAAEGKTTRELQSVTSYTGIYRDWNLDLSIPADAVLDDPWRFGGRGDYPRLWYQIPPDSPPPGGPRVARPPQDTPYDPAADHPEVYVNDRYDMAVDCEAQTGDDGEVEGSLIRFDLGRYEGVVILHLAVWNGEFFMSYESQDIDVPPLVREGQSAWVRVVTDPGETRFLLDGVSPTRNLVLGYADCHTDDPGAELADPAEAAATSTAATSTPAAPRVYVNERYGMTADCDVQHNADGEPDGAVIRFDLGSYQGDVLLSLSLWNGEWYASYESLGIDVPLLEREGRLASVRVVTDPGETRFLLDGTPNGLRMNLVLGYADCHTAGG